MFTNKDKAIEILRSLKKNIYKLETKVRLFRQFRTQERKLIVEFKDSFSEYNF